MNTNQAARFKAYTLALAHVKENDAITNGVVAIEELYLNAKAMLDAIANTDLRKIQILTGITDSKLESQNDLADLAADIASVISSYATKENDLPLKAAVNFSKSELFASTNQLLSERSTNILAKARELGAKLKNFGVTDMLIDNFASQLERYVSSINEPRNVAAERKQAGMYVSQLFRQLRQLFTDQLDPLLRLYKNSHHEFYNQYLIKRNVVNTAQRKTRVEGTVTDKVSLEALAGVTVMVKGTDLGATTDSEGNYSVRTPLQKQVPVVYEKKGYKPLILEISVKRGQTTNMNVVLERT